MLDIYYWPTPNGWKGSILLEELRDAIGLDDTLRPVNIGKGKQFTPEFWRSARATACGKSGVRLASRRTADKPLTVSGR